MRQKRYGFAWLGWLVMLAITSAGMSAVAQDATQPLLSDQKIVVIPERRLSDVAIDIDNAGRAKQLAMERNSQAENRLREIENAIDMRKLALKDVDRRKDEAKKNKRESEAMALKIESKAKEQAIDLLNKLKDLRKAEIEEAKAEAELADIEIRLYRLEDELQLKRLEYDSVMAVSAGDLSRSTAQRVLRELEVQLLKLQEDQAKATEKVASKQKDIVKRRMKLHEAQIKLGTPQM